MRPVTCAHTSQVAYQTTKNVQCMFDGDINLCNAYLVRYWNGRSKSTVVRVEFYSQEILELEDGRNLIVLVVETLLKELNYNPMMVSKLKNPPFNPNHLHVILELESFYSRFVDSGYLGRIELRNGIIYYSPHSALDFDTVVFEKHQEWYPTAREIVRIKREIAQKGCIEQPIETFRYRRNLIPRGLLKGSTMLEGAVQESSQ